MADNQENNQNDANKEEKKEVLQDNGNVNEQEEEVKRWLSVDLRLGQYVSLFIEEGYDADLTIVDLNKEIIIKNENIASKSGWSPFNRMKLKGSPVATIINGSIKMIEGKVLEKPNGKVIDFD